jgi:regulatory protein
VPSLTALRRAGPGRVTLELDGRRWRTVPDDVVVRVGLVTGIELDRPLLRRLRAELGRARAQGVAGRALARRDLSRHELERRLDRARVAEAAAAEVVERLAGAGLVDDARVAAGRAAALAERGWGDAAITARLAGAGLREAVAREAVATIAPEADRARRLVAATPEPRRAAALLARRGFSAETVEDVLGAALD